MPVCHLRYITAEPGVLILLPASNPDQAVSPTAAATKGRHSLSALPHDAVVCLSHLGTIPVGTSWKMQFLCSQLCFLKHHKVVLF